MKHNSPQWLGSIWTWRGVFEAHIPSRCCSWQGYWAPSTPIPLPLRTSERGRPASPYMSTSDSMPLAASKLWYQNSPGSLCLKNAPADLDSGDRGREKKERGWKERKHKRTRVLPEERNERKQKEKNYLIAQHRSALQNTEVILFSLTSVCIERILIDLSLGAWMK